MLENARRQAILVSLTLLAAILVGVFLPPYLGTDLKGGTQLIYEIPEDVLAKMQANDPAATPDAIMTQTVSVIRERIDPTGTIDVLVSRRGQNGILIELPSMEDAQLKVIEDRIESLGKLEMRIVLHEGSPAAANPGEEKKRLQAWLDKGGKALVLDSWKNIDQFNSNPTEGPIAFGKVAWYPHLITPSLKDGARWAYSFAKQGGDAAAVQVFEDAQWNNSLVPENLEKQELLEFVAIDMQERAFTGEDLDASGVSAGMDRDGTPAVLYRIKGDRSDDYADWSEKYIGKNSAIILNNVVKSAPRFEQRIPGSGQIHGDFSQDEVNELVKTLRTGSLRVEPERQSKQVIGPTLGATSIKLGLLSLLAGAAAVFAFMLAYYRTAGIVACFTLLLNVTLLYAAMLISQATITLPGLGGIVLTMGMAVDANILIYERIREELTKGKDLLRAVRAGFDRAMVTILDANITTFLTGLVLFGVGVGPVRGFAVTLMWGIITTVFTQFFVTRLLFHFMLERGWLKQYRTKAWFSTLNFDFVSYVKRCAVLSTVVILTGLAYTFFAVPREVLLGLDFTGGANLQMVLEQPVKTDEVRDRLANDASFKSKFISPSVNFVGEETADGRYNAFNMRLKLSEELREKIAQERREWRAEKERALAAGEAVPADYVPPYLQDLKRVFEKDLVQPAASGAKVTPNPENVSQAFAEISLHFQRPVNVAAAQAQLQAGGLVNVKVTPDQADEAAATESRHLYVQWTELASTREFELFGRVRDKLGKLNDTSGQPLLLSNPFPEAEEIGGRMVGELRNAAIGALILSWLLIILYLRVRFHEYKYGIAAVIALVHDVLVALSVVALCNHLGLVHAEIDLNMIACFLTIVGYSVNDTIVIFDRIRENLAEEKRLGESEPFPALINRSINQTLSRTILTTGVTMFVVLAQFLVNWGSGSALESFAFAMLVGMVSGTYSTVYIAAPVLIWLRGKEPEASPGDGSAEAAPQPVATSS